MLKTRFDYIDVDGVPAECETEVRNQVLQALQECALYLDCDRNSADHLRLVLIPAVEQAISTAIMEYDADLFVSWYEDNYKPGKDEETTIAPWEPIVARIVHEVLQKERPEV